MPEIQWVGLFTVLAAGVCQGSFMLPMKWTKYWKWENTWLIFASTAYLLCPWIIVLSTIPQIFQIYSETSLGSLLGVIVFGVGWGIGALTFGLGVAAVGMALGFAVILGLAACAGTLIPLVFLGPDHFSLTRSTVTGVSLALMLSGVARCSWAGKWKEQASQVGTVSSYRKGITLCALSGLLSSCGNLGYVFGSDISRTAQLLGVPSYLAPNAIWALLTLPLFFCNASYSAFLLRRNKSFTYFGKTGTRSHFLLAALMGILWMGGFTLYGIGVSKLGQLGPSLGWSILMSCMVLVANIAGVATGEWAEAPASSKKQLGQGILLLLLAIVGLGYANQLSE